MAGAAEEARRPPKIRLNATLGSTRRLRQPFARGRVVGLELLSEGELCKWHVVLCKGGFM